MVRRMWWSTSSDEAKFEMAWIGFLRALLPVFVLWITVGVTMEKSVGEWSSENMHITTKALLWSTFSFWLERPSDCAILDGSYDILNRNYGADDGGEDAKHENDDIKDHKDIIAVRKVWVTEYMRIAQPGCRKFEGRGRPMRGPWKEFHVEQSRKYKSQGCTEEGANEWDEEAKGRDSNS